MIGIVDYGSGNLKSVFNAFRYIGEDVSVCKAPSDLDRVDKMVLPGVGSSKDAMEAIAKSGYKEKILSNIDKNKPFLGICLGLQLLFDHSEESGGTDCIGLVPGQVKAFKASGSLKVPQIGWNNVSISLPECPIFRGIRDRQFFYFVHSYYCSYQGEYAAGMTEYGVEYTSALWKDNIFAVQFHPERSQSNGLRLLENFSRI